MSDELNGREVLEALKRLEEKHTSHQDAIGTSKKYFGWIQALIAIVAVILSLGISWGITTAKLSAMETTMKGYKEEISKLENDVHTLQLAQARDDLLFKTIDATLGELKDDVKKLVEERP